MAYTLFELQDGREFFYDSNDNTIYNGKGETLNFSFDKSDEWYEQQSKEWGTDQKTDKPVSLRILLGHACNYNCSYCMQKDIGDPSERPRSLWTETFIEKLKKNLSFEKLSRVELWGGEPFLYWKDMVAIMEFFDHPDRYFFISTNGSAFVEKHYEFFKKLKSRVMINVSHDAKKQELTRGVDVFKNPKKVDVMKRIFALPNVSFAFGCVVSSENHDLFEINEYFKDFVDREGIVGAKLNFIPARNYDFHGKDENSAKYILRGETLKKFNDHMYEFLKVATEDMAHEKTLPCSLMYSDYGVVQYSKFLKNQAPIVSTSKCGADSNRVLSVDLQGNIRLCPHSDNHFKAGSIDDLKDIRIHGLDLEGKNKHCMSCHVKRLCKSSCPIKFPDEVFYSNCALEKVWWGNIQLASMRLLFGQDVSMISTNLSSMTSL